MKAPFVSPVAFLSAWPQNTLVTGSCMASGVPAGGAPAGLFRFYTIIKPVARHDRELLFLQIVQPFKASILRHPSYAQVTPPRSG